MRQDIDQKKVRRRYEDVKDYEDTVRRQAALAEQARLKEQYARKVDCRAKSIKGKSIANIIDDYIKKQMV